MGRIFKWVEQYSTSWYFSIYSSRFVPTTIKAVFVYCKINQTIEEKLRQARKARGKFPYTKKNKNKGKRKENNWPHVKKKQKKKQKERIQETQIPKRKGKKMMEISSIGGETFHSPPPPPPFFFHALRANLIRTINSCLFTDRFCLPQAPPQPACSEFQARISVFSHANEFLLLFSHPFFFLFSWRKSESNCPAAASTVS